MKITRLKKRSISVFVIIALLLSCLPLSIFASDDIPDIEVPLEPEIKITEVLDRREESIKHFKMPDGTYNAISYAGAVHRKNSDGEWIDINNDLSITTIGSKQLYTTNDSRVTFSRSYSSNEDIMTLRENGYVISMALLSNSNDDDMSMDMNATASLVTVNNSNYSRPESFDTIDEAIEINNKSSIFYSNVLSNTDIEYVMNGNDIKENIIVKDRSDSYVYAFRLSLDGLVPILDDNGAIYLNDEETEETIYVIPAPYMYDSNDEYSEEVYYELFHVEGDKYLLTVTADESWINDEDRAFPVTVDPTVVTTTTGMHDAYINSNANLQNSNYGLSYKLVLHSAQTVLINIPLPSIHTSAAGGIFEYANLYVNYYGQNTYGTTNAGVHKITGSWSENSVTYSNINQKIDGVRHNSITFLTDSGMDSYNTMLGIVSISSIVEDYYSQGHAFYGLALKYVSGNGNVVIKSHESSDSAYIRVHYSVFENGTYTIQNEQTKAFLQVDDSDYVNNYESEGAAIEAHNVSENTKKQHRWRIEYLTSGYFVIISKASDRYLSLSIHDTNMSGNPLKQLLNPSNIERLWRISKSDNGNYVFRPIASETFPTDWCMVQKNTTSGEIVTQKAYTDDLDFLDEWSIYKENYSATVNNFYDKGYFVRYGSTELAAKSKIYQYNLEVAQRYMELFGLSIRINNVEYFESNIDICKGIINSTNIDSLCTHGGTIHTDRNNVISNFKSEHDGNDATTGVFWSGHKIVSANGDINRSCSTGYSIFMLEISTEAVRDRDSKGVLLHELNHQYGAQDHYHEMIEDANGNKVCKFKDICSECGDNPRPESCIMNDSRQDISPNDIICDLCKAEMIAYLEENN